MTWTVNRGEMILFQYISTWIVQKRSFEEESYNPPVVILGHGLFEQDYHE
jgi:hypothetical protein